jgi:ubiquitin-protein ligase
MSIVYEEKTISIITLKRLVADMRKFNELKPEGFSVYENPDNKLEIFFLMKGNKDTPYEGGEYLCKIIHSPKYPLKAPDYIVLTPNGRFETNVKICLTNSGFHQSDWAPAAWNLVTILQAFSSIWHSTFSDDTHGIGHLNSSKDKIIKYADDSIKYNITNYNDIYTKLIDNK